MVKNNRLDPRRIREKENVLLKDKINTEFLNLYPLKISITTHEVFKYAFSNFHGIVDKDVIGKIDVTHVMK